MNKKSNFTILRRAYFTLLEILIVIAILALFAGITGVNVVKAYREQKFNTEVEQVVSKLRLAQDLMLLNHDNVKLIFYGNPHSGYKYQLHPQNDITNSLGRDLLREHPLKHIKLIEYTDLNNALHPISDNIVIRFWSEGSEMSRGILRFVASNSNDSQNRLEKSVCLPGYPSPIQTIVTSPSKINELCFKVDDLRFNDLLTQKTREDLQLPPNEDDNEE